MRRLFVLLSLFLGSQVFSAQEEDALAQHLAAGHLDSARAIAARLSDAGSGAEIRYYLGRLSASDGEARRHFRQTVQAKGRMAADAQFELAESAYADPRGLYVTARRAYQAFVTEHPGSPHVALALYRIGRTYQVTAAGRPDSLASHVAAAQDAFRRVIDGFPDAPIAKSAAVALVEAAYQVNDPEAASRDADRLATGPVWSGEQVIFERAGKAVQASAPSTGAFWVQVGVFANEAGMQALVKRLRESNLPTRLVATGSRTTVQCGPFETRARAERMRRHISTVESIECRVIQE